MRPLFREILTILVLAIVIFLLLQFTIQTSVVKYSSMEPTLNTNQWLVINKISYHFGEPDRGDVIIFRPPNNQNPKATPFIKRIIGIPGDTVEVKEDGVYVNGSPLDEPYIKESPTYILPQQNIPENHYFVLGDNRNNSNDSHHGWTVPRQNIIGKAWLSIWPLDKWGLVANYLPPEQLASSMSK